MSKFLKEIKREIEVRLDEYKRELKTLENAAVRIAELKQFVAEAEVELKEMDERIPSDQEGR